MPGNEMAPQFCVQPQGRFQVHPVSRLELTYVRRAERLIGKIKGEYVSLYLYNRQARAVY